MNVTDYLNSNDVVYDLYEHEPIFSVGDDEKLGIKLPGTQTKNLFLKDKKSKKFFLVSMNQSSKMDLKSFGKLLGGYKFSFGKAEDLANLLNVSPGSVSVFGKIFDNENQVNLVIDQSLLEADKVAFHPNINTQTVVVDHKNFKKFLDEFEYTVFDFTDF